MNNRKLLTQQIKKLLPLLSKIIELMKTQIQSLRDSHWKLGSVLIKRLVYKGCSKTIYHHFQMMAGHSVLNTEKLLKNFYLQEMIKM